MVASSTYLDYPIQSKYYIPASQSGKVCAPCIECLIIYIMFQKSCAWNVVNLIRSSGYAHIVLLGS